MSIKKTDSMSKDSNTESASKSLQAVVLYDYDAVEADEISLKEGETLVDVLVESQDWWLGTNSAGYRGLFPGKICYR